MIHVSPHADACQCGELVACAACRYRALKENRIRAKNGLPIVAVPAKPSRATCQCGECDTCLHRAFVNRQRIRERLGWLPKAQRMERFMVSFASVYWSEVYRRGVPSPRFSGYRN